jgi:hypothetical protein
MRHRALPIFRCYLGKRLLRFFVPEGMQHGYAALKFSLDSFRARGREVHRAKLRCGLTSVMVMAFVRDAGTTEREQSDKDREQAFHWILLSRGIYRRRAPKINEVFIS